MAELLPCPFCGDEGEKGRQTVTMMAGDKPTFDRITCRCCGAMAPELNWQKRAPPAPPTGLPSDEHHNQRAIRQAIDLIDNAPKGDERLATIRRVLRGAVLIDEAEAEETRSAQSPAPTGLPSDEQIQQLVSRSEVFEYHPGAILEFARELLALSAQSPAPVAAGEVQRLTSALEDIADMTFDPWTNGARAGEIARAALESPAKPAGDT